MVPTQIVAFSLCDRRYGLPLSAVDRIVRMVEVTSIPKGPDIVLGVINVQGRVVPVFNVRRRFHLPEREIGLADQLIVARGARRPVALVVDAVTGVLDCSTHEVVEPSELLAGIEYVQGVVKLDDGLLLIHDLDKFLSLEEEEVLNQAMESD